MSDQNPIHRDRGRRRQGDQPYEDEREQYAEKEARIHESAPFPDVGDAGLTEEERRKLDEEAAADRFTEIGDKVSEERAARGGDDHGH